MSNTDITETYAQTIAEHYDAFKHFVKGHNLMENVDYEFSSALTNNRAYRDRFKESACDLLKKIRADHVNVYGFTLKGILNVFCQDHPKNQLFNLDGYGFEAMPRENDNMLNIVIREAYAQTIGKHFWIFKGFVKQHKLMENVDDKFSSALTDSKVYQDTFKEAAYCLLKQIRDDHIKEYGFTLKGILSQFMKLYVFE